jgi:hypothetical protein
MRARVAVLAAVLFETRPAPAAGGQTVPQDTTEVPLFSISKSENKNRVQYAVRVDRHCAPISEEPIFAYWQMLELGATRIEPLLAREVPAYGPASQTVLSRDADGGRIRLILKALPTRPILVQVFRASSGACQALSTVTISGSPAHLYNVHAKLRWPGGVAYLLVQGWSLDGTHVLSERLKE